MALADRIRRSPIGPASPVPGGRREEERGQRTRTRRGKKKNSHRSHLEINFSARMTLRASDPEEKSTSERQRHRPVTRITSPRIPHKKRGAPIANTWQSIRLGQDDVEHLQPQTNKQTHARNKGQRHESLTGNPTRTAAGDDPTAASPQCACIICARAR